jgi:hypothetical protein
MVGDIIGCDIASAVKDFFSLYDKLGVVASLTCSDAPATSFSDERNFRLQATTTSLGAESADLWQPAFQ